MLNRLFRRTDDGERGAILVMAAVGMVLAVIAAALAVDLGRLAEERRRDQRVADLAVLDAVRAIPGGATAIDTAAKKSASGPLQDGNGGNKFPVGTGFSVTAVEGAKTNGSCVQAIGSGTVCVTVKSTIKNQLRPGSAIVIATAQGGVLAGAAFTEGSKLATANVDTELPIVNGIMSKLVGASGTLSLVSYQGLANANVTLRQLKTQLNFGTLNDLLNANLTLGQILAATTTILNNQGTVASIDAASKLAQINTAVTNTTLVKLGDWIKVAQGYDNKALDGDVNVLQMLSATAELANTNHFLDAGALLTVPNPLGGPVLTTKLGLTVIDGPKLYIGPKGGPTPPLHTAQVALTITPHLAIDYTVPLLNLLSLLQIGTSPVHIEGDLPITFSAAGADGTLADVRCTGSQGITVSIQRKAITTTASANLSLYSQGVLLQLANVRANIAVGPTTATVAAPGSPDTLVFNWPTDFTPSSAGQTTPGAPANLSLSSSNVTATVGAAGLNITALTGLSLSTILTATINPILTPIVSSTLTKVATPALKALGLSIGPVDVTAPAKYFDPVTCGQPGLTG